MGSAGEEEGGLSGQLGKCVKPGQDSSNPLTTM